MEDGRNYGPKHVELIGIINKLLLLHLVGCLYYCRHGIFREQRNVTKTEVKSIGKWKDLALDTQCMWNVQTEVVSVIAG